MERRTPHIELDTRLVGLADFQLPPSGPKKPPRHVKRRVRKVKEKRFRASTSSSDFLTEQFSCIQCGQETKLSRSLVVNHLRRHRLGLQEYLDKFDTPANQARLGRVRLWVQKEEYLSRISGQDLYWILFSFLKFLFRSRREKAE